MGSAAAFHLAKAGRQVLGIDRFTPPHSLGSSHGATRIIREAYFEHPAYVPLVQRAYELWADLEQSSGRKLLLRTGGLMIGSPDGVLVSGAKRSADQHRLDYEMLSAAQLRQRFPALSPTDDMVAVAEPRAGILFPESAIEAHLQQATHYGAELNYEEAVLGWDTNKDRVSVVTSKGRYEADWLILSAGPWLTSLIKDLRLPLVVERQVLLWFEPKGHPEWFGPERFPIFIWQYSDHGFFYGFPDLGQGVKAAQHHQGEQADPDAPRGEVTGQDMHPVQELLRRFIPQAEGNLRSSEACLYTNAPDEHFVFGVHPAHQRVIIVSPCSGHGFKFSPVIGELIAHMVGGRKVPFDVSLFSPGRLG